MAIINGIVTIGVAETPGEARILLFNEDGDTLVDSTMSDASTGEYSFTGLPASTTYRVIVLGGATYRSKAYGPCTTEVVTDPDFASVMSLLPFDGTDGATSVTDIIGRTWTLSGNAQLDTAIVKYGSAALLLDGSGDYLEDGGPHTAWGPLHDGSSDYCLEMWLYPSSITTYHPVCTTGDASAGAGVVLYLDAGGVVGYDVCKASSGVYAARLVTGSGAIATGGWVHIAVDYRQSRAAGQKLRLFINGVKVDADDLVSPTASAPSFVMNIGRSTNFGGFYFAGSIDDWRVTYVSRYDADFTPPTEAHPTS